MKNYIYRDMACPFDLRRADMVIQSMANEGFTLSHIGAFGKLVFVYDSQARKYEYFSYIKIDSQPLGKKMHALEEELCRVYETSDVVSIDAKLHIYRFDTSSRKFKLHLDQVAEKYGLQGFTHESYLEAVRCRRDEILMKNYTALAVLFGLFVLFFAVSAFFYSVWTLVPCAIALYFCIYNIMKRVLYTHQ